MNAAGNGDVESVKILLARGAEVNAVSAKDPVVVLNGPVDLGYYTPLMLASLYGPPEIVALLLHAGANVDAQDIRGRTALHYAVSTEAQNPEIVRLLLKGGADSGAKDSTAQSVVDWAAKYSNPGIVGLLHASVSAAAEEPAVKMVSTRQAVERSLPMLQKVSNAFMKNGGCIACHAQNLTAMTAKYARAHGFTVDEAGLKAQFADLKGSYIRNGDRFLQRYDGGGGIDTLDYAMLYFEAAGYPPDPMTDAMVYNMVGEQMADGSWERGGAVQRAGPSPAARAPMQDSDIVRTALSLRAIQVFSWEGRKVDLSAHVQSARAWLRRAKPVYNEEFVMQLLGFILGRRKGEHHGKHRA